MSMKTAVLALAVGLSLLACKKQDDAAAAADIDDLLAGNAGVGIYPVEAQGIDLVERLELGFGVPPAVGEVTEFLQFGGIGVHETASGK